MQLTPILPCGHLYAVENVFPKEIADRVADYNWASADYTKLTIGKQRRRLLKYNANRDEILYQWIRQHLIPTIEQACSVKFLDGTQYSFTWWVDEPGFKPDIHTDGDKPSAMQLYWLPTDRNDLGTAFYSTNDTKDVIHYFANRPNSGYLMFNTHKPRPMLWHDMQIEVPEGCLRLCLYLSFGPYQVL
jgi:hypothetical protein